MEEDDEEAAADFCDVANYYFVSFCSDEVQGTRENQRRVTMILNFSIILFFARAISQRSDA